MRKYLQAFLCALTFSVFLPSISYALKAGMPNPPESPTKVYMGVFLADVISLNELEESFEAELIISARWHDPRLAFDAEKEGVKEKLYQGEFQFNEVFEGWWPQITILNEIGDIASDSVKITVTPDGWVHYLEKHTSHLETPMQLEKFPFDHQKLKAYIKVFGDDESRVKIEKDPMLVGASKEFAFGQQDVNIAQWHLIDLTTQVKSLDYRFYGKQEPSSVLEMTVTLERKSANIVWKVLFPLILLVSMMWSVFWMDRSSIADRLNVAFIGILTIVAYQFLIEGNMPRIDYFTLTDSFLMVSFLTMCATIAQSLIVYSCNQSNRDDIARKVDIYSRWLFPVCYVLMIIVIYLVYVHAIFS